MGGGILGAVFGWLALQEIEDSGGAERGKGVAGWAIGLGILNIAVTIAVIIVVVLSLTHDSTAEPVGYLQRLCNEGKDWAC